MEEVIQSNPYQISEPMTMATDYLICAASFYFFYKLRSDVSTFREKPIIMWAIGFLFVGMSSFFGGTYHGLKLILGQDVLTFFWKVTVLSIGLASFYFVYGTVLGVFSVKWQKIIFKLLLIKLILYSGWMFFHNEFLYVIMDYAPSLLMLMALGFYCLNKDIWPTRQWTILAVVLSFMGAYIQQSKLAPHAKFNHNDLYHIIQTISLYFFYKGSQGLKLVRLTKKSC